MLKRISIIVAALATAAILAAPALATTNPVGVWKLDEGSGTTVADSSGSGDNGVLSGGVAWVNGVFGSALGFDGSSGQVEVSDNAALEPMASVTLSAWFRGDRSPGLYRYIAAKGANGCIAASYGLYSGPSGGLEFYVAQGHGSIYAQSPDAGRGVWDGGWHLAVGTYDGRTIRLYVDGDQVESGTPWAGSLEYRLRDFNDFYIGNYPGCANREFLGAIDDVMVWNRALTAREISAVVPPGGPPSQPTPPPGDGSGNGGGNGSGTGSGSGGGTGNGSGTGGGAGGAGTPTAGGTGSTTTTQPPAPSVHGVKLSTSTVTIDTDGHVVSTGSAGVSLTYTESQSEQLTVTLLRSEKGVRRGRRCVAGHGGARHLHCARFVVVSTLVHAGSPGRLTVRLTQLFPRRLTPGTYRLDVTPRADGKVGKTVRVRLVVKRTARPRR